jgi:glycosyltransferase involved in cell wall biosynthesis
MNKTMEYMAYALPVLAYRLTETVVSAGECAVYCDPGDVGGFAGELIGLLGDPERRERLGKAGRVRAERELDWAPQAQAYLSVYRDLLSEPKPIASGRFRRTSRRLRQALVGE